MEDQEELTQGLEKKQNKEEQLDETIKVEDKVEDKTPNEIEVKVKVVNKSKGKEKVKESEMESSSSKQICKQNTRAKVTIPKPFSLATDQRMSRERNVPIDTNKGSKPIFTKSASFNYKNKAQTSAVIERTPYLKRAKSTTTSNSLRPRITSNEKPENSSKTKDTIEEKEVKKPQLITAKKQQGGKKLDSNKLQKSLSYKALPLPKFYHQKDPSPKQDTNKNLDANSKPALVSQKGKTVAKSEISISRNNQEKGKMLSGKISSGANGNLTKIFRSTTTYSTKDLPISVVSTA